MTEGGSPASVTLRRSIGTVALSLYGIGVTIGAGIYVLTGLVAGFAGYAAPLAFLLAGLVVAPTAFSFAELAARMPKSAGEALYVLAAFDSRNLSILTGFLVIAVGTISSATVTNGAAGYVTEIVDLPPWLIKTLFVAILGLIAAWGVVQSVTVAVILTLIEVTGLLVIIATGLLALDGQPTFAMATDAGDPVLLFGIFAGALIAFFAFIGFEDMVNMAEEVKEPEKTLPRAIAATLIATTILYGAVALIAVSVVGPTRLAASSAPLALVFSTATGSDAAFFSGVAILATVNTVLVQVIMASRVLYGMAETGTLHRSLGVVHPITRTPLRATALAAGAVLLLALIFPIDDLARATSAIALLVFSLVNAALLRLKWREQAPVATFRVPWPVPLFGILFSGALLIAEIWRLAAA